ncbi:MAG: hypothetical protein HYV63_12430 [Candidatus Schekmanbacteria bacterium]|nr:hypothetical protein [Candidatus Schekmanbacteria bacterium]
MAKCPGCGKKVNFLTNYCDACIREHRAANAARAEEQRAFDAARDACIREQRAADAARAEEARRRADEAQAVAFRTTLEALRAQVAGGRRLFLYESLYLPVDSVVLAETTAPSFDIGELRELGLAGWEVVGVVPRTAGVALENKDSGAFGSVSYGGGVGGNVVGVHLLMRKEMRADSEDFTVELAAFVTQHGITATP